MTAIPRISIENVTKRFGSQTVLDGVDLQIPQGQSLVIIGQSGCGKSVLIKHIIRLLTPDSGRIVVDGEDVSTIRSRNLPDFRRKFGMLFQGAALFDSMSVFDNIALGLREQRRHPEKKIREIVLEKIEMVGLSGSETKGPAELSGGMRKRVGLARAIAHDPEVMLYDEPTTGLDPVTADVINDLIVELNQKLHVTSVTVTHDMVSAFKIAERIVMLDNGKVAFDGTPDEVEQTSHPQVKGFMISSGIRGKH
ncbi:MAG: ABC transporter ATP-binding protein [Candidatus Zixiibacteriota bacterium]